MALNNKKKQIVYLIGAGASHGSVKSVGSSRGILMKDLSDPLHASVRELVVKKRKKYGQLINLVNDIIDREMDIEHVITLLDESASAVHRQFANDLRQIFAKVLKKRLKAIKHDLGDNRYNLYSALLDMYLVEECPEQLRGILSINYDEYVEAAVKAVYGQPVDFGIAQNYEQKSATCLRLLKLHGSFNWQDTWPIKITNRETAIPLWIPPGIQKAKNRYPFNVLWGLAREMLDCDILRIIGCRLSDNDWDLISLLFATRHTNAHNEKPYVVEVIDSPTHALNLKNLYPYLDIRSLLEIDNLDIGRQLISELTGGPPKNFDDLDDKERKILEKSLNGKNWFRLWLIQMAEGFQRELNINSFHTPTRRFEKLLNEA